MKFHVFPCKVPPPQRENKAVRGYYTRAQLTDAIRAVIRRRMTVAEAAAYYKIPRPTLQKKVAAARNEHQMADKIRSLGFDWKNSEMNMQPESCIQAQQPGSSRDCYQEPNEMVVAAECEIASSSPDRRCPTKLLTKPIITSHRTIRDRRFIPNLLETDDDAKPHILQSPIRRPQINRIVIKAPTGEILKQFVLEEKPNDMSGTLDRAWHQQELVEDELIEDTLEEHINVEH